MTAAAALRNQVLVGDARDQLTRLPATSIDMVLTSPPYWALRDYAVSGQLGSEPTVDDWVEQLATTAAEIQRVLTPTGSFWLNLGDTYSTNPIQGAAPKSLLLGPERLALRLIADGWILRNKIVWQKANPMPTSVRDRLACTWEALYVFVRQSQYFFDLDAVRVAHTSRPCQHRPASAAAARAESWRGPNAGSRHGLDQLRAAGRVGHPLGKNPGDVWRLATSSYRSSHHAAYPVSLAERAIRAGCPEARCRNCRAPWRRQLLRDLGGTAVRAALGPTCACNTGHEPGLVLDPFIGSGSTAVAAKQLGRDWLGIELNPDFAQLTRSRLHEARAGPAAA